MAGISSLTFPNFQSAAAAATKNGIGQGIGNLQDVDKEEFLKLLVAQLKNQDPMNPMKNEEFVTQLATFSSLEQLISINKAVTELAGLAMQGTAPSKNKISG